MNAPIFTYAPNMELQAVAKALIDKTSASNPFMRALPQRQTQFAAVQFEREDSTFGLMQARGYNGKPHAVAGLGSTRRTKVPGVYGETLPIDEYELTNRAQPATYGIPIGVNDLIQKRTMQGRTRMYNRMTLHYITLLTTGHYIALAPNGAVVEEEDYTPQVYTPAHLWSDLANGTPWADFQNLALLDLGFSVAFNSNAVAVMNQKTFNFYRQNQNQADIAGRRSKFGSTFNSLGELNQLHQDDGLPVIEIFNDSYLDDSGVARRFMPDGYVVVMGKRSDGQPIGEFLLTRNASNADFGSQLYYQVIDHYATGAMPRKMEVAMGYNGGLAITMPEAIVTLKVA